MKVLVIDDSPSVRTLLKGILASYGHETVLVSDRDEAWRLIPEPDSPRIVILDWTMPGLDGNDLCRHIRLLPETDYKYVLLTTARDSKDDIAAGLEAGADDYLVKPINTVDLNARLRSAVRTLGLQQRLIAEHDTLQSEKEKIRLLLDSTAEGIIGIDNEGRCTFSNHAALLHLGYESECQLVGCNIHETLHHSYPDGQPYPVGECRLIQAFQKHESVQFEDEYFWRKDGTSFPVEYWFHPIRRDGEFLGAVLTFWDSTKRRMAEEAKSRSDQRFQSIAENTADLIAVVDLEGHRIYNSPSYFRVLGFTPEELKQTDAFEQIHPDDREKVIETSREAVRTGVGQIVEYRMQRKDGTYVTLESHGSFIRNSQGAIEALVISARDVGHRKLAEHAQKMEAIGQLAAGIAHEINTPVQYVADNISFLGNAWGQLGPILGACAVVQGTAEEDTGALPCVLPSGVSARELRWLASEIPSAIAQSLEGAQRIGKIVSAMRKFSHSGSGEKTLVDLNDALETAITVAHNETKHVTEVTTDFQTDLPKVVCFASEMNQVFLNLIVNASHAIADALERHPAQKGCLIVRTHVVDNDVQIEVQDNGIGIPDHAQGRVFEPFFTTKAVGRGTGQGLAICHDIVVNKHQGRIWFETEVGHGTTFFLRIPIAAQQAASAGAK